MITTKGNKECNLCPLHLDNAYVCTMGRGEDSHVMVIMESPSGHEAITDTVAQGKAGKFIRGYLEDAYYTTAVKCTAEKTPTAPIIKKCAPYLEKELARIQPEYVLLIGSVATKAIFGGSASVKQMRGQFFTKDGIIYMPTLISFYDEASIKLAKQELEKFVRATEKGIDDTDVKHEIIDSFATFRLMLEEIDDSVVLDLETTGLDPRNDRVTMVGVGLNTKQYLIPMNHAESPFDEKQQRKMMRMLEQVIRDNYIILINHNLKFDLGFMHNQYNWKIKGQFDTMLAQHSLNENLRKYGLKELASDVLNAPNYDISKEEKKGGTSLETLAKYCANDLYYTRGLYDVYVDEFNRDTDAHVLFTTIYMPAMNMLVDVEKRGVYVDETKLHEVIHYLRAETGSLLFDLNSVSQINWNSTKQVAHTLFRKLDMPITHVTPKGAPSVGVAALTELSIKGYDLVDKLINYRKMDKLLGSFAEEWSVRLKKSERLYPSFNLHRTTTGRTSSNGPNIQQVPKNKRIRSLVTAPPGKVLIECDLSQIELRIVAMYSQDPTMMQVYADNGDIHTTTAEATSSKKREDMTPEEFKDKRSKAKPVNFGFVYGMGWSKFIQYAKVQYGVIFTEQEARKTRNSYFQTYTYLAAWHAHQRATAHRKGYVESPIGRKRRLPEIHSQNDFKKGEAERQAINSPVQSFGSDLLLMAAIEINADLPEAEIVALIHDAILIECEESIAEEIAIKVKAIMENPKILRNVFKYTPTVPLIAEYELGPWGSK
jgi:uracil-DNA glycosylase family 4